MLKNITLGQFFPGESLLHRLDPRMKIILTAALIAAVFLAKTASGYLIIFALIAACVRISGIKPRFILGGLKPIAYIVVLTFVMNLLFSSGQDAWFRFGIISIGPSGLKSAAFLSVRLVLLVLGTQLLTLTTSPIALTDGLEALMKPFSKIGFPAHELAMMMTIALRFIPTLLEETDKIMKAQSARGADFESGNLLARAKAMVPLLVPLFVSAIRRADELALAMEARCYHGGEGRTRMKVLRMGPYDVNAGLGMAALIVLVILAGRLPV